MPKSTRSVKFWIAISLISLIAWATYLLVPGLEHMGNAIFGIPDSYVRSVGLTFWASLAGDAFLLLASLLGLISILLSAVKSKPFIQIRGLVTAALVFESVYYLGFIPSVPFLIRTLKVTSANFGIVFLGIIYILQILLTVPFLLFLAFKVARYRDESKKLNLLKWGGLTFAAFVASLWANIALRWVDMLVSSGGTQFLFVGIRPLGFFSGVIFMSLAVVFAVVCSLYFIRQKVDSAIIWLGLSLAMIGFQYAVFLVYAYAVNFMAVALLLDWWTVPLLGLGVSILVASKTSSPKVQQHHKSESIVEKG